MLARSSNRSRRPSRYDLLAAALDWLGELDEAVAACDAGLALDPEHLDLLAERVWLAAVLGDAEAARAATERIERAGAPIRTLSAQALTAVASEEWDEAIALYDELISLRPLNCCAVAWRGVAELGAAARTRREPRPARPRAWRPPAAARCAICRRNSGRSLRRNPVPGTPCQAPSRRDADHRRHPPRPPDRRAAGRDTRPTSDRVRENAFNLIGPVDDADVLDLFAGSGAMGLEALSRGAAQRDVRRVRPRRVPHDQREPRQAAAEGRRALPGRRPRASPGERRTYDLVLCDPPYGYDRRAARAAPPRAPRDGRAARLGDRGTRAGAGGRRASSSEPPASTAPHGLPCSSCDHRHLPRHLRPRHERARRRDHARGPDLRPRRRRRRRQPAPQDAAVRRSPERVELAEGGARRRRRTSRSTSSASSSSTSPAAGTRR